jgi:polysaccharide export outer membrane protein
MTRWLKNCLLAICLLQSLISFAGEDYELATGDLVRVTVYDHQELTTETRVTEQGTIPFPLIGEVKVAGTFASEAASLVAEGLKKAGILRSPQVNVVVMEFKGREVSVLGAVNRPGKYPLQRTSRLTDVLAMAGGVAVGGGDTAILIQERNGKTERRVIDLLDLFGENARGLDVSMAKDDILYIPREAHFYIYGEVQRPGIFRLEKNMTVAQGLAVGGGLTMRGTLRGMKIMRHSTLGKVEDIRAGLTDLLQPDDVIYISESLF